MDRSPFWRLIEATKEESGEDQNRHMDNHDTLADRLVTQKQLDDDIFCEDILSIATRAYKKQTGQDMPDTEKWAYPPVSREDLQIVGDDAFAMAHFPRLWERFGED